MHKEYINKHFINIKSNKYNNIKEIFNNMDIYKNKVLTFDELVN